MMKRVGPEHDGPTAARRAAAAHRMVSSNAGRQVSPPRLLLRPALTLVSSILPATTLLSSLLLALMFLGSPLPAWMPGQAAAHASVPGQGADAQDPAGGELPTEFPRPALRAYLSHAALPQGGAGRLLITLEIATDFHIQINDFLEVLPAQGAPVVIGPWTADPIATHGEERVLKGRTTLEMPVTVAADAPVGAFALSLTLGFQGCAEEPVFACFPPDEAHLSVPLEILPAGTPGRPANEEFFPADAASPATEGPAAEAPATETPVTEAFTTEAPTTEASAAGTPAGQAEPRDLASRLEGALSGGSFIAFLLVFLGGILTSFTPCVYPMIPLTISYVGGRAKSRGHGFFLSLFFVLGIAIMYSALGVLAASTGSVFGSAMQSPVVLAVVAVVFAVMGASMLGAFSLALPSGLQGRMTEGAQRGGVFGAVLMGMVTGLVASPCVGPVLVVLLTFVAQTGNVLFGFWLLFTFACGLGLLFLVLGTFAGAISALPGAGSWMDTVKHLFGVVLLGMAIYYVRSLIGPQATALIAGAYLSIIGVFTGAFTPLPPAPRKKELLRKSVGLLLFLAGTAIFLAWLIALTGAPGLVRNGGMPATTSRVAGSSIPWRVNDEAALGEARSGGRPVIQDFYADWCAACVELDEKTWIDPAVVAEASRFVPIKMDFTRKDEFSRAGTERYAIRGMPTVILYDSAGNEARRFFGFKGPRDVLAILQAVR
ncbi:MAG: cytochrome c biogenesis protein CcdA [Candidatus Eisenbacteria bacterium]